MKCTVNLIMKRVLFKHLYKNTALWWWTKYMWSNPATCSKRKLDNFGNLLLQSLKNAHLNISKYSLATNYRYTYMEVKLFNYKSSFNKIDHPTLFHSILFYPFLSNFPWENNQQYNVLEMEWSITITYTHKEKKPSKINNQHLQIGRTTKLVSVFQHAWIQVLF